MKTIAVETTNASLADLLAQVALGEEITITQNGQPKAKLTRVLPTERRRPKAGSLKGKIWMAPDFDEPLEEFKEYME